MKLQLKSSCQFRDYESFLKMKLYRKTYQLYTKYKIIRFSGPLIGLVSGCLTIARSIASIAEAVFKGFINILGAPFSNSCSFSKGLQLLTKQTITNVCKTPFSIISAITGLFTKTLATYLLSDGYLLFKGNIHAGILEKKTATTRPHAENLRLEAAPQPERKHNERLRADDLEEVPEQNTTIRIEEQAELGQPEATVRAGENPSLEAAPQPERKHNERLRADGLEEVPEQNTTIRIEEQAELEQPEARVRAREARANDLSTAAANLFKELDSLINRHRITNPRKLLSAKSIDSIAALPTLDRAIFLNKLKDWIDSINEWETRQKQLDHNDPKNLNHHKEDVHIDSHLKKLYELKTTLCRLDIELALRLKAK